MTKSLQNLPPLLLAILLTVCVFSYYSTRNTVPQKSTAAEQPLVDTSLLQTALKLAPLAVMPDEQVQAREARRLADHELDLTFRAALRQAEAEAEAEAAMPAAGPLRQLREHIGKLKERVAADKKRVEDLGKKGADEAADYAQAQLDLDQDELDDAQGDLVLAGGGKRARLQRLLEEHEASAKVADQAVKFGAPGATGTMSEQLREWLTLGEYNGQLQAAEQQAGLRAQALLDHRNTLQRQLPGQPEPAASVARLRELSVVRKRLANLDQRIDDDRQLGTVYQHWRAAVKSRQRGAVHLVLGSLAEILVIILATVLLYRTISRAFRTADRRRVHQLRLIAGIALQLVAVLLILLILFGPPTQVSTMIGLITAGLTVVMKDFIVAFFGWFTLMGKNGISVGDWVEIEGVSGEVVKIGLLKTVLLELGNGTETGHPTGRRVAFSNSFAMERHYFNFTTAGQWLWDEIQVMLPVKGDPYETARQIQEIVERETQADAAEAAKEWQRVDRQYGVRELSAMPAVNLRPAVNGLEVVVRYITRAPQRNAVKSKLFQAVVDLLHKPV